MTNPKQIDLSAPGDEDGPILVNLEDVLSHRVVVSVRGKDAMNLSVREMLTYAMLRPGVKETKLQL